MIIMLGALQDWVWEIDSQNNETCFMEDPFCKQGRIPQYSVMATSALHVQHAVRFAKTYNLRLVIRNTGHDGAGRSSAPDSLQVYTHHLKGIVHHRAFIPDGLSSSKGQAVTVGAGVMLGDLYKQGATGGYSIVGGECATVGAAGGFLLGGGLSPLAQTNGLAVDNILELEVVMANVSAFAIR